MSIPSADARPSTLPRSHCAWRMLLDAVEWVTTSPGVQDRGACSAVVDVEANCSNLLLRSLTAGWKALFDVSADIAV